MEIKLKAIRKRAGLSQKDIAKQLGVDWRTYGTWERGDRMLSLAQAYRCAIVLNCTIDEIAGRMPDNRYSDPMQEAMNRDYAALSEAGKAAAAGAVGGIRAQEGREGSALLPSPGEVEGVA